MLSNHLLINIYVFFKYWVNFITISLLSHLHVLYSIGSLRPKWIPICCNNPVPRLFNIWLNSIFSIWKIPIHPQLFNYCNWNCMDWVSFHASSITSKKETTPFFIFISLIEHWILRPIVGQRHVPYTGG